ncbi:hypothetical protein [Cerasicoccus fimbriatus]|uniref:hypothetical protein n=1 Tax=Cerasicoccus fimbriatus TaxID=3014554 RepID=UPI0022B5D595|nr:hypothetical protein [Cerasicoccus sp. TK19100]
MSAEWQLIAAKNNPIKWTGDLDDDCTARWAGLILRAEAMDDDVWWWAVTDEEQNLEIDSSNRKSVITQNGKSARLQAEAAAKQNLLGE